MSKYYYDCPIQALYMINYFAVDLDDFDEPHNLIESMRGTTNFWLWDGKIYVAKESEHIFEPKEGDYGIIKGRIGNSFSRFHQDDWVSHANIGILPSIIMRDGKQFFMPKKEENE